MDDTTARRLRAFKRWMRAHGIVCSDALHLAADEATGVSVRALGALREGDLVATIPRRACLTPRTSGAAAAITAAELGGCLAVAAAVMYERALGDASPWYAYLRLLPDCEPVPLVWPPAEGEMLLAGTELEKIVKQDRLFLYQDWKECIEPLVLSGELEVEPDEFSLEKFLSAKTLVSSRSFEIDNYHGSGMVPLADLFNHKTGEENIHFTSVSAASDSDGQDDNDQSDVPTDDQSTIVNSSSSRSDEEDDDDEDLEIIIVRDVDSGEEVFNTYGTMGNGALLHRYGFTELDNPYDIVNIDLALVTKWCSSMYSNRYARARVSLWRNLGYSGCTSQDSEYFEISYGGEPQLELLVLLYIIFLKPEVYEKLICIDGNLTSDDEQSNIISLVKFAETCCNRSSEHHNGHEKMPEAKRLLLTESVCSALVSLADMRDSLYGSNSLKDNEENLQTCYCISQRKQYHSLVLRVSERRILGRLRAFASGWSKTNKRKCS